MNIRLYFLGTGAAVPIGKRGLPCIALRVNGDIYLFDAGEGCQYRLFKAGLGVVKIKTIFITHLHGDHFLGLFGMLQSMHMLNKESPLSIYGPSELENMIKTFLPYGLERLRFNISFGEISEWSEIYRDDNIVVTSYPVKHGTIKSFGFIVDVRKRIRKRIVYTGDTCPIDTVVEASRNANILIHESTFTSEYREEALKQGHSTAADAALAAQKANVDLLVLTHISARYDDDYELFIDAYRFFKKVIVAQDYMSLIL